MVIQFWVQVDTKSIIYNMTFLLRSPPPSKTCDWHSLKGITFGFSVFFGIAIHYSYLPRRHCVFICKVDERKTRIIRKLHWDGWDRALKMGSCIWFSASEYFIKSGLSSTCHRPSNFVSTSNWTFNQRKPRLLWKSIRIFNVTLSFPPCRVHLAARLWNKSWTNWWPGACIVTRPDRSAPVGESQVFVSPSPLASSISRTSGQSVNL